MKAGWKQMAKAKVNQLIRMIILLVKQITEELSLSKSNFQITVMRILLFILFLFCIAPVSIVSAQSKEEIQKQMQEAVNELNKQITDLEKQITEAKNNKEDPESIKQMEDDLAMLKKQVAMMGGLTKNISKTTGMLPDNTNKNPFINTKIFPEKKTALLESLPKREINKQELSNFLNSIYAELKQKLPPKKVSGAQSIINLMEGNIENIALAGTAAWYDNAPSDALLLLTYAATKSASSNTLNNCAAVFNLCGLEDKAIPVLKYILNSQPDNSTVLNNLGQAYAGLGDLNTASGYLRAAMVSSPSHPEACATAAYIEAERGNTAEAVKLMTEAVKTGYTDARVKFLEDKGTNNGSPWFTMSEIDLKNKQFFRNDFDFPPNCRQWANCEEVYAKQEAFNEKINAMVTRFQNDIAQNSQVRLTGYSPFSEAVYFKLKQIGDDYTYRATNYYELMQSQFNTLMESTNKEIRSHDEKIEKEYKACEGRKDQSQCQDRVSYQACIGRKAIDDKYYSALADIADNYRGKKFPLDMEYTNKSIWLMSLRSTDDRFLKAETGAVAMVFLENVKAFTLSVCFPSGKPNCEQYNPANPANPNSPLYKNPNCPINIVIPAGALKMNLNCSQFKIDAGQLIKFTYEKDFITKETTIAVGPGASIGNPYVIEAGVKAQAYVKFDGNNQPVDAGVSAEAELEVTGPISPVVKAGFTVGINSGVNPTGQLSPFVGLSTFSWR